jgi:hypothetical protein
MAFLLFCFAVGAVTTTTSIVAMQFIVNGFSQSLIGLRDLNWDQIEMLLQSEASKATFLIVAVSIVNILFSLVIAFFFSHRVAGVVLRLTNSLRLWSAGKEVPKIIPRDGDFFIELVDEVNEVIKVPRNPAP